MVASQVDAATRKLEKMTIQRAFSWMGNGGVKNAQIG
jgi:hypothetical protein